MKALMVRTDFSLGESALKAENAVKIARDAGYTAVISADSMNIASVIPLQRAAGDDMAVICGVRGRLRKRKIKHAKPVAEAVAA